MKQLIAAVLIFCNLAFVTTLKAQEEEEKIIIKNPDKEKNDEWSTEKIENKESKYVQKSEFRKNLRIGGNFGLSPINFSNSNNPNIGMYIGLDPQITYVFDPMVEAGLALGYTYMGTFGDINYNLLELGPIIRFYPIDPLFLQAEWRLSNGWGKANGQELSDNFSNYYVGGGYITRMSENSYTLYGIKFNLVKSAYTNNQIMPSFFFSFHFGI